MGGGEEDSPSSTSIPINSSNIGFQLLKKHGWTEGTGLGVAQQGRLEPLQPYLKKNKRGLGADKAKKFPQSSNNCGNPASDEKPEKLPAKSKGKGITKKMKKIQEFEKRLQEKEFERAFFREFWPDNCLKYEVWCNVWKALKAEELGSKD